MLKRLSKVVLFLTVIGFVSNIIWENLQAPLYEGYNSFWQHFNICFVATLGDVLIILTVFTVFALIYKNVYWFSGMNVMQIIFLVTLGAFIAVVIEAFNLGIGRWAYTDVMPTIGGIGLLPILQMMILLPLTFYVTSKFIKKYEQNNYKK